MCHAVAAPRASAGSRTARTRATRCARRPRRFAMAGAGTPLLPGRADAALDAASSGPHGSAFRIAQSTVTFRQAPSPGLGPGPALGAHPAVFGEQPGLAEPHRIFPAPNGWRPAVLAGRGGFAGSGCATPRAHSPCARLPTQNLRPSACWPRQWTPSSAAFPRWAPPERLALAAALRRASAGPQYWVSLVGGRHAGAAPDGASAVARRNARAPRRVAGRPRPECG